MIRPVVIVLAALALAGCAEEMAAPPPPMPRQPADQPPPPPPPPPRDSFRESDFGWSTVGGTGRIVGQLAYRGPAGGHRYTCTNAILAPETPWTQTRMEILYLSDTSAIVPADEARARTPTAHATEYQRYVHVTTCDPSGRFVFAGLPSGAWYVITAATPVGGGPRMALMRRIETHGTTLQVILH